MHLVAKEGPRLVAGVLALVLGGLLLRNTIVQGQDFEVFWKAAQAVLSGQSPYDTHRFGAMVYKYPPWSLILFLPLGFFDFFSAKIIWAVVELTSLLWIGYWLCAKASVQREVVYSVALGFYGIWAVHFLDGQIALPILAASLFLLSHSSTVIQAFAGYFLSFKIFPLFALASVFEKKKIIVGLQGCAWILLATWGVLILCYRWDFIAVSMLFPDWLQAADSGDQLFGLQKTLGRENQGLPAFGMRYLGLSKFFGILFSLGPILILLGWSYWKRIKLFKFENIAVFLAWTAVIHPLAWFHSFVFAFPLTCIVWQKVLKSAQKRNIFWMTSLSLLLVAATQKTLGNLGLQLELFSVKSWAVLGMSWLLYRDHLQSSHRSGQSA